jgi:hypothetical protein
VSADRLQALCGAWAVWCALAALGALLAACAPPPGAADAEATLGLARGSPDRLTEGTAPYPGAELVTASLPTGPKPPQAPPSVLTLTQLNGLSASELKAALGDPTLLRRDGPAQLWQYAGSGCVLHVFLYEDNGSFRVTYSEVRIDDPAEAHPPICAEAKGKPPADSAKPPGANATRPGAVPSVSLVSAGARGD